MRAIRLSKIVAKPQMTISKTPVKCTVYHSLGVSNLDLFGGGLRFWITATMYRMHMRTHVTGFGNWALVSSSFNDYELESSRDATQNNGDPLKKSKNQQLLWIQSCASQTKTVNTDTRNTALDLWSSQDTSLCFFHFHPKHWRDDPIWL